MTAKVESRAAARSATRHAATRGPGASRQAASLAGAMQAHSYVGVVASAAAGRCVIRSGPCEVAARRAASCLLEPAAGDTVAWTGVGPGEAWVTAVLQREPGAESVLRCEGATRLEVEGGGLRIAARSLALASDRLSMHTQELCVVTDSAEVTGRQWRFVGAVVKAAGAMLSTVFDRVNHFSKSHMRTTEGIDRVQATHMESEASQVLKISGQHTLVNGEKLVKARGAQIHFG